MDTIALYLGYAVMGIMFVAFIPACVFFGMWLSTKILDFSKAVLCTKSGDWLYDETGRKIGSYSWKVGNFYIRAFYYRKAPQ